MLLRSSLLTVLRELEALNEGRLAAQLETYYSGSYAPCTMTRRNQSRQLLVSTYQFDAYFVLGHGKPPILHCQEVDVCLQSSFALWNAYGLDVFATRLEQELPGRSEVNVSEFANHAGTLAPLEIFAEDVQLGLCSVLQAMWVSVSAH